MRLPRMVSQSDGWHWRQRSLPFCGLRRLITASDVPGAEWELAVVGGSVGEKCERGNTTGEGDTGLHHCTLKPKRAYHPERRLLTEHSRGSWRLFRNAMHISTTTITANTFVRASLVLLVLLAW